MILIRDCLNKIRAKRGCGISVLDIGCGNGFAVTRFLPAIETDEVLGIDLHAPSIEYAKNTLEKKSIHFECMRAEELAKLREEFDAIVLADILEHVEKPEEIIRIEKLLLKEDGIVLVTIPNGYGPFELESLISKCPVVGKTLLSIVDYVVAALNKWVFKGAWNELGDNKDLPYNEDSPHINFFSFRRITSLFEREGLYIQRVEKLSWLCGPFSNYIIGPFDVACRCNVALAELLPKSLVSAWYLEVRKNQE